jgi:hypothetical protein
VEIHNNQGHRNQQEGDGQKLAKYGAAEDHSILDFGLAILDWGGIGAPWPQIQYPNSKIQNGE